MEKLNPNAKLVREAEKKKLMKITKKEEKKP